MMPRMELSTLSSEQYRKLEAKELFRVLAAKACARWEGGASAEEYYRQRWGTSPAAPLVTKAFQWEQAQVELRSKAAVPPATTADSAWAKPLVTSRLSDGYL